VCVCVCVSRVGCAFILARVYTFLVSYREEKSVGVGVTQLFLFEIACDRRGMADGAF